MKVSRLLLAGLIILSVFCVGCSESTDPETTDNEAAIAAMAEIDQMIGTLSTSESFTAVTEMPVVAMGNAELNIKLPDNFNNAMKKSGLGFISSATESNPMALFMYLFFPNGTYTYDGYQWSYDELPNDEIIFLFPFQDPSTGAQHNGKLRYYDIQRTAALLSVSTDIYVDNAKLVEITIQINGSGLLDILQNQEPVITSISVQGYVIDDTGTQNNFSFSINETQVTLTAGVDGQTPLQITMTGDLLDETSSGPESVVITYGLLSIHIDDLTVETGDVGYITYNGIQVEIIKIIDGEAYVVWNDGTQSLLDSYFPNSSLTGGEFI